MKFNPKIDRSFVGLVLVTGFFWYLAGTTPMRATPGIGVMGLAAQNWIPIVLTLWCLRDVRAKVLGYMERNDGRDPSTFPRLKFAVTLMEIGPPILIVGLFLAFAFEVGLQVI